MNNRIIYHIAVLYSTRLEKDLRDRSLLIQEGGAGMKCGGEGGQTLLSKYFRGM
jgi:hypothetical protein